MTEPIDANAFMYRLDPAGTLIATPVITTNVHPEAPEEIAQKLSAGRLAFGPPHAIPAVSAAYMKLHPEIKRLAFEVSSAGESIATGEILALETEPAEAQR